MTTGLICLGAAAILFILGGLVALYRRAVRLLDEMEF